MGEIKIAPSVFAADLGSLKEQIAQLERRGLLQSLREALYGMDLYSYKLSLEERKTYIIVALILQKDYYSMQKLADELYVTRNTVINDCKVVEQFLSGYPVTFMAQALGMTSLGRSDVLSIERLILAGDFRPEVQSINDFTLYGVIVSCPGSMATSKYIEAQLKRYFNLNIVNILTTRQVERAGGQFENVDFIVSTVEIHNSALSVAVVSPLLTLEDIGKLQRMAFQRGRHEQAETQHQHILMSRMYSIYQNADARRSCGSMRSCPHFCAAFPVCSRSSPGGLRFWRC